MKKIILCVSVLILSSCNNFKPNSFGCIGRNSPSFTSIVRIDSTPEGTILTMQDGNSFIISMDHSVASNDCRQIQAVSTNQYIILDK